MSEIQSLLPYPSADAYLRDCLQATYAALSAAARKQPLPIAYRNDIVYRLGMTPQADTFALVQLQKRLHLSALQLHAVLVAEALAASPTSGRDYAQINANHILPTIGHCVQSFASVPDWYIHFTPDFLDRCFQPVESYCLWERHLLLVPDLRHFLHTGTFPESACFRRIAPKLPPAPATYTLPEHTILSLYGAHGSGKLHFVQTKLLVGKTLLLCSLAAFLALDGMERQAQSGLLLRCCLIEDLAVCFCDDIPPQNTKKADWLWVCKLFSDLFTADRTVILCSESPLPPTHEIRRRFSVISYTPPALSFAETVSLWETQGEGIDGTALAQRFHFLPQEIRQIARQTRPLTTETLLQACRDHARTIPLTGVQFVEPKGTWDDLILAKREKDILRHACDYIHHSATIYEDWGFCEKLPYGRNLSVLMEGPSGTGKTMAAGILANDLGLPLLHLNTAQVLSRYIGETEKQLKQVFTLAEQANAILLIDEMDVLFGKRAQIKDAHDKYANMQTSFLLQQIESFRGILLLTTNFLTNIDEAFLRRIQFVVHFSLPTEAERLRLWRLMFPPTLPLANSVDFAFLAKQFPLSGGEIKNIALHAAFLAAGTERPVDMQILLQALQSTLGKQGKVLLREDFGEYGYLLEPEG